MCCISRVAATGSVSAVAATLSNLVRGAISHLFGLPSRPSRRDWSVQRQSRRRLHASEIRAFNTNLMLVTMDHSISIAYFFTHVCMFLLCTSMHSIILYICDTHVCFVLRCHTHTCTIHFAHVCCVFCWFLMDTYTLHSIYTHGWMHTHSHTVHWVKTCKPSKPWTSRN